MYMLNYTAFVKKFGLWDLSLETYEQLKKECTINTLGLIHPILLYTAGILPRIVPKEEFLQIMPMDIKENAH